MPYPAQVVEFKAGRNGAGEALIGPAVGKDHLACPAADSELDVARLGIDMGGPEPAAIGMLVHAGEEALIVVAMDALADKRVTVAVPALVVGVAPAATVDAFGATVYSTLTYHIESLLPAALKGVR